MKVSQFAIAAACVVWILLCPGRSSGAELAYAAKQAATEERLDRWQAAQDISASPSCTSRAMIVVMVCAGAGLVVFILLTTFSGQTLASTRGLPKTPTGCRRKSWDELTRSPQF